MSIYLYSNYADQNSGHLARICVERLETIADDFPTPQLKSVSMRVTVETIDYAE